MSDGSFPSASSNSGLTRAERRKQAAIKNRRGARRSWPQKIVLVLLVLASLTSFGVAAAFGYGLYRFNQIERVDVVLAQRPPPGDAKNILVVGSDSRDEIAGSMLTGDAFIEDGFGAMGQRSDTIMIVRVEPRTEHLKVLSLPRDLWLPIAGTDHSQRINTSYAQGPQGVVDTIEDNFGIPIHHYIEVNFVGFAHLVEAVGGVPMWFDTPLRDRNSGLVIDQPGCHVLGAEMALAYARSRHLEYETEQGWLRDGTGDLGRITRQQVFLRRALDQINQLGVTNILTLNRLLGVVVHNTIIDRDLNLDTLVDLGTRFANFEGNELETMSLPVYPYVTSGGAAVLGLVEAEAESVLEMFRGENPLGTSESTATGETTIQGTSSLDGEGEPGGTTALSSPKRISTTTTAVIGVAPDAEAACK